MIRPPTMSPLFPYTTLFRSVLIFYFAQQIVAGVFVFIAFILYVAILLASSLEAFVLAMRSEEHTSELQSRGQLVCRLLLEKIKYSCIDLCKEPSTNCRSTSN